MKSVRLTWENKATGARCVGPWHPESELSRDEMEKVARELERVCPERKHSVEEQEDGV